ncbi:MAG: glycosyltransferase family 39 protein [Humidesulfovibrio sp.]|uniref:ArnT family glycosyltransferase n=1 Tax=Humidesulfovibrio sp. TaxID=2910988 RepID=UPI0027F33F8B|nr:glycosyltransferase family 39 protein [Humidesulfovibrio sp.]MDQ7834642.1 glycosyltransferase family 39 protein [Humidesulfovibrio sp.]
MTALVEKCLDRLWDLIRRSPWLALAVLTAMQTAFTLQSRALWFSDEVRYADAYAGLLRGRWLVLSLNGVAYPDKPPLYFWFLRALDAIPGVSDPAVFFLGAAASGLLVLYATLALARALKLDDEAGASVGMAAGLILLSTLFFSGLLHYSRMDLLFTALIIAAQAAFCLAFTPGNEVRRARLNTLALFLAGLATLTKGPLGLLFPVLTTLLYLTWRGRAREFFRAGMLPGLLALLALVFSWVLAAYFVEGPDFLRKIFVEQIFQRATKTFHHAEPFYFYLVAFPPCWLPWTLALLALPVRRLFDGDYWRALYAGRKASSSVASLAPVADAKAWLWISFLSGLTLLSLLSGKVVVYILPQLPPLALLLALELLGDKTPRPWRRLWTAAGILFLGLAAVTTQAERFLPVQMSLPGIWAVAGGFAACGLGLLLLRGQTARRVLPVLAILTALWVQPAAQSLSPALDAIMSPKPQADVLKDYAAKGYLPVAHDIYQGIYSYYVGGVVRETAAYDTLDPLVAEKDVVLAIKKKHWDKWETRPRHMVVVLEQWLAGQPYYIAITDRKGVLKVP